MGGMLHWYSEEGPGPAAARPSPLLAVPNITAHPSTASVPITVLLYGGPLLCGFNVVMLVVWLSGNALASINVFALRQTRLVSVCGRVNHLGM